MSHEQNPLALVGSTRPPRLATPQVVFAGLISRRTRSSLCGEAQQPAVGERDIDRAVGHGQAVPRRGRRQRVLCEFLSGRCVRQPEHAAHSSRLKSGQQIHSIGGGLAVASIEPAQTDEAHDLIVQGFATCFVGHAGVMVHDNTFRKPTTVLTPGLSRIPVAP